MTDRTTGLFLISESQAATVAGCWHLRPDPACVAAGPRGGVLARVTGVSRDKPVPPTPSGAMAFYASLPHHPPDFALVFTYALTPRSSVPEERARCTSKYLRSRASCRFVRRCSRHRANDPRVGLCCSVRIGVRSSGAAAAGAEELGFVATGLRFGRELVAAAYVVVGKTGATSRSRRA